MHAQVAAINTAMSSLVKTITVFPRERSIVARERSRRAYDTLPYLSGERPDGLQHSVPDSRCQCPRFSLPLSTLSLSHTHTLLLAHTLSCSPHALSLISACLLPAAKLLAELPVSCIFPLVFGAVVYPFTGLNPNPVR